MRKISTTSPMKKKSPRAGTLTLAIAIFTTIFPATAIAEPLGASCTPVEILAFRGTGEPNNETNFYADTTMTTNGWEGKILRRVIEGYVAESHSPTAPNPHVDSVPVHAIGPNEFGPDLGYPAASVPVTIDTKEIKKVLADSIKLGASTTRDYMDQTIAAQTALGCPRTKFIVLGYSQGAMAARLLTQMRSDDIVLSHLFGDPLQFTEGVGNHGTGAGGNGFVRYISSDDEKTRDNQYYNTNAQKVALCHKDDPFCDYNWLFVGLWAILTQQFDEHTNYGTSAAEIAEEGQTISRTVAEVIDTRPPELAQPERNYIDDIDMNAWGNQGDTGNTSTEPSPKWDAESLSVSRGEPIKIHTHGIPEGEKFGFRITPFTQTGSWRIPAIWASEVHVSGGTEPQTMNITIDTLPPGTYTASVFTGTFQHTPDVTLTIQ